MFQTPYVCNTRFPEVNSGEIKVERSGYIPAQEQVEAFINAGQRLDDFRKGLYDMEPGFEGDPDKVYDYSRDPNFDMADATQMGMAVKARLDAQKEAAELAQKASEAIVEPQGGVQEEK
ncbi:MAG: hypothetical protein [Arizlama microvirus]|nr:MAG: hypothetical protein [Arizlama microvirus]